MRLTLAIVLAAAVGAMGCDRPVTTTPATASTTSTLDTMKAHCCQCMQTGSTPITSGPLVEPCWNSNAAGNYARWMCGAGGSSACSDNGRSCTVGNSCTITDVPCSAGTVVECDYPWYP
jgi:hypothetical protein